MSRALSAISAVWLGSMAGAAADPAGTALATLMTLQGRWTIRSADGTLPFDMTYDAASKNSILTEQFGKELSVFYRDGSNLLMTHFCNAGNQPRLRLKMGGDPRTLEFIMFDITNLKAPDAAHVQKVSYRVIDDRDLDLAIVWQTGPEERSENYRLHRR